MTRQYRQRTWIDPRQTFLPSATQGIGSFASAPTAQGEAVEIVGGSSNYADILALE